MKTPTGTSGRLEASSAAEILPTQAQTMPRSKTTKPDPGPLSRLPTGTVTFMLTDVEGSTKHWEVEPEAMKSAMSALDRIIAETIDKHNGARPLEQGEGDSAVAAFARASDAVDAAVTLQLALRDQTSGTESLSVRIGLHSGEAELRGDGTYAGIALSRCSRIRSAAHGGQVVISGATYDLVLDHVAEGVTLKDLGPHRLKDLSRPERIYQVCHSDLPNDFPSLRSLDSFPNNLPRQMTSFIGREDEIVEMRRLLQESRLVTVTGSGGCGKSRLALQVAAEALEDHPDGVWWVELASVSDASLVPNAAAAALSIREVHSQLLARTLSNHISQSRALMILDNCEHLVSACADLVGTLLHACPGLTILATSREPLGVDAETSWRVRSLSLPVTADETTDSLVRSEAVRLFIDRARQCRPDFRLTEGNAPSVTKICTRLDGIPLAIELAAARVRVLAPQQIVDGLTDRFRLLTGSSRTAAPRQQTLQASVDWSYDALSEAERTVLMRVSVFAGGFSMEAAEAVAATEGVASYDVLDLMSRLVDRSLVLMEDAGEGARFRLLETIRQYTAARLAEAGAADDARTAHRDYYLGLAEQAEPLLTGFAQEIRLAELDLESENLRSALEWCRECSDPIARQRLSGALSLYWLFRGRLAEGEARLRAALESSSDAPPALRAKVMWGLSYICAFMLDLDTVEKLSTECLAIAHDLDDRRLEARSLLAQGWPALYIGGDTDPVELFERSADLARGIDDSFCLEESLQGLGLSHNFRGDPRVARAALEECIVVARGSGNRWSERQARTWLGWTALFQGELREARALLETALSESLAADDQFMLSMGLYLQGVCQGLTGEYDASYKSLEESLEVSRASGNIIGVALSSMEWGWLKQTLDDSEAAASLEEEARMLLPALGSAGVEYQNLSLMARARLARGGIDAARELLDSADESAIPPSEWIGSHFRHAMAKLRWHEGAYEDAEREAHEALSVQQQISDKVGIVDSLELLAAVASSLESFEEAGRLLGAAAAVRESIGYARNPLETPGYEGLVEGVRETLGAEGLAHAQAEGEAMSIDEAIAYASRGRGTRKRPTSGWRSLTPTEQQVIQLVGEGLSNPEIGERLFVSRETIKTHLSSIFGKLGVSSRAELAAQASVHGV
jgi:predicted ATPase/class 3 adenylate cyclase/DNA-binding CsgD family transcriptional regulator